MPTQVQSRRGTTSQHSSFTGAAGELTVDTDKKTVVVHDGSTAGGAPLLRENQSNLPTSAPTTGIYNASGSLAISTGGARRVQIDSNGYVQLAGQSSWYSGSVEIVKSVSYGSSSDASLILGGTDNGYVDNGRTSAWRLLASGSNSGQDFTIGGFLRGGTWQERLRITSAGLVGIGSSTPGSYDAFADDLVIANGSGNPGITLAGSTTGWGSIYFADGTTGSEPYRGYIQYGHTNDRMTFATAGSGAMHIDSSQRVGIGTSTPGSVASSSASQLVIANTADASARGGLSIINGSNGFSSIYMGDTDATTRGYIEYSHGLDALTFGSAGGEAFRIDSSKRLLVGTSSARSNFYNTTIAGAGLQVEGSGDLRRLSVISSENSAVGPGTLVLGLQRSGSVGGNTIVQNGDLTGTISFMGNDGSEFVEHARIASEVDGTPGANDMPGRLVFSTTADGASSPTERMRIRSSGLVYFNANMIEAPNWAILGDGSYTTIDSRNNVPLRMGAGGAGGGPSTQGVQLSVNATSWSTWSDERYKADLVPIADGLQKVGSLRAVTGRYKEDDESVRRSFLIAQDLQAVLPEAVDETDPDRLGLRYTEVIPLLVAALKESKERIETLEAKVAALESA